MQNLKDVKIDRDQWGGPLNAVAGWMQSLAGEGKASKQAIEELDSQLALLYSTSVTEADRAFESLVVRLKDAGWSMEDITAAFPQYIGAQNDARDATGETSEATRLLAEALGEQADALKRLFDPVFAAIDAQDKLRDSQQKAGAAAGDLSAAQAEYDRVMGNSLSTDAEKTAASLALYTASGNLTAAELDLAKAAVGADAAMLGLAKAEAEAGTATSDFRSQLDLWIERGVITADQADRMQAKFIEVRAQAEATAGNYQVNLSTNADEIAAALGRVSDKLDAVRSFGGRINIVPPEGRARGGPVNSRSPYLVGEEGPELFIPAASGRIVSHGKTKNMLSAGSGGSRIMSNDLGDSAAPASAGGSTYNITINGLVSKDKQDMLTFLARELPKIAANHSRSYG